MGAKYLPVQGNVMIHFDSHPDLLLPMNIKAQDMNNVHNLYEKLSIENWILPACYLGVIDTIIWVKPPWSNQIQDGHYNFKIGKQRGTGKVLISCLQNYFIAEGLICDPNEMENPKDINLYVLQISNFASINALREAIVGKPIILDIDLDFFSTRNPFLNIYQEIQLYSTLKQIYLFQALPNDLSGPDRLKAALQSSQNRRELLDNLDDLTTFLANGAPLEFYEGPGSDYIPQFQNIQKSIRNSMGSKSTVPIDWKSIHDAGCTCDDTDLPHHVASHEEILSLLQQTKRFIQSLQVQPILWTIARSSLDDFCPMDQVDFLQSQVVEIAEAVIGRDRLDVKCGYQDMDT